MNLGKEEAENNKKKEKDRKIKSKSLDCNNEKDNLNGIIQDAPKMLSL